MKKKKEGTEFITEACLLTYRDQLDASHSGDADRLMKKYIDQYGNEGEAKARMERNAMIYETLVHEVLKSLDDLKKVSSKSKKQKEKNGNGRVAEFNPEFLYETSVDVFRSMLNRKEDGWADGYLKELVKKYKDKDRAMKRFRDRAQIYASEVRSVFKALDALGRLPEQAKA